ncbi:MAG: hypothetical protein KKE20_07575, partial [Nanoarchaeota archaeon]|nr:hypothetical protein [Nanoarchaeota archaeon]
MLKKSQVTAFIIVGIVILVMIGSVGYMTSRKYSDIGEQVPPSMSGIKIFVDQCLKDTAEGAILLAGVQGGVIYFSDVVPNQQTFYSYSTYWYDAGQ